MPQVHLGGSFAPPLDATKLAEYRRLGATAFPQVREIIEKLADMVELFQQTPRSKLAGTPHPVGRGTIVPLEDAEIKRIWDAVPWDEENDMYHAVAGKVQAAEEERNSAKVQAWTTAVIQTTHDAYFPTIPLERALKVSDIWDDVIALIGPLTPTQTDRIETFKHNVQAYQDEVRAAVSTKRHATVPYPTNLEDTRLRTAVHHLVWWAKELAKDREPITTDQL